MTLKSLRGALGQLQLNGGQYHHLQLPPPRPSDGGRGLSTEIHATGLKGPAKPSVVRGIYSGKCFLECALAGLKRWQARH